jgi:hypothetical protein
MAIDYKSFWPKIVDAQFQGDQKNLVHKILTSILEGDETYIHQLRLAVLRKANGDVTKIEGLAWDAKTDFREFLCEVQFPLTTKRWGLREKDPLKYDSLSKKEQEDYMNWIQKIIADNQS